VGDRGEVHVVVDIRSASKQGGAGGAPLGDEELRTGIGGTLP